MLNNGDTILTKTDSKESSKDKDIVEFAELVMSILSKDTMTLEGYGMIKPVKKALSLTAVQSGVDFFAGILSSFDIEFSRPNEFTETIAGWLKENIREIIYKCGINGHATVSIEDGKVQIDPTLYITDGMGVTHRIDQSGRPVADDGRVTMRIKSAACPIEGEIYQIGLPLYIYGCVDFALAYQLRKMTTHTKGVLSNISAISYSSTGTNNVALAAGLVESTANQANQSLMKTKGNVLSINAPKDEIDVILPVAVTAEYSDFEKMVSFGMLAGPVSFTVAGTNDGLNRDILYDATSTAVFNCKSMWPSVTAFLDKVIAKYLALHGVSSDYRLSLKAHPSELRSAGSAINAIAVSGILTTNELRRLASSLLSLQLDDVSYSDIQDPNRT